MMYLQWGLNPDTTQAQHILKCLKVIKLIVACPVMNTIRQDLGGVLFVYYDMQIHGDSNIVRNQLGMGCADSCTITGSCTCHGQIASLCFSS